MAGDWIKVETALPTKREVFAIAEHCGINEAETVGHLVRLWCWADANVRRDGDAPSVTLSALNRLIGVTGFAEALVKERWLEVTESGVRFVNFDRHMSKSAKQRALTRKRNADWRSKRDDDVTHAASRERHQSKSKSKSKSKSRNTPPSPPEGGSGADEVDGDDGLSFPEELDTQDFRRAWDDWVAYRRERRLAPPKPRSRSALFARLAKYGSDIAVRAIEQSISNNWQGLFPEKLNDDQSGNTRGGNSGANRAGRSGGTDRAVWPEDTEGELRVL